MMHLFGIHYKTKDQLSFWAVHVPFRIKFRDIYNQEGTNWNGEQYHE